MPFRLLSVNHEEKGQGGSRSAIWNQRYLSTESLLPFQCPKRVFEDMRSCAAAVIHVGSEGELFDAEGNKHIYMNQGAGRSCARRLALLKGLPHLQVLLLIAGRADCRSLIGLELSASFRRSGHHNQPRERSQFVSRPRDRPES